MDDFLELVSMIGRLVKEVEEWEREGDLEYGARPQLEEPNSWVPPYVARSEEGYPIPARVDYPAEVRDFESERARAQQARGRTVDDQF
jgi:hypothetical protein